MKNSQNKKIVVYVPLSHVDEVREAIQKVHPYEEVALDVYSIDN